MKPANFLSWTGNIAVVALLCTAAAACQQKQPQRAGEAKKSNPMGDKASIASADVGAATEDAAEPTAKEAPSVRERATHLARALAHAPNAPLTPFLFASDGQVDVVVDVGEPAPFVSKFSDGKAVYECFAWRRYAHTPHRGNQYKNKELCAPLAPILDKFVASTAPSSLEPTACEESPQFGTCCEFEVNVDDYPSLHLYQACYRTSDAEPQLSSVYFVHDGSNFDEPSHDIWQRTRELAEDFNRKAAKSGAAPAALKKHLLAHFEANSPIEVRFSTLSAADKGPRIIEGDKGKLGAYDLIDCWLSSRSKSHTCRAPEPVRDELNRVLTSAPLPVTACEDGCCKIGGESFQVTHNSVYLTGVCYSQEEDSKPEIESLDLLVSP